jgi:hypothetical protein
LSEYSGFDLAGSRGPRPGATARRALRLGLCLVLFAGVAAACGSSSGSSTPSGESGRPSLSPVASAPGPSASQDLTAFDSDSGGFGTIGSALEDAGYTDRYESMEGLDHLTEAYDAIAHALPTAVDLNQVTTETPGDVSSDAYIQWEPMGRRDTLMPPGNHGERIYEVEVDLGPYLKGGDAVAYVWYLSRAEGDALDPYDLTATPQAYPNKAYSFALDKATAGALLDIFWVKGAPPTASPSGGPQTAAD